jgi:hypothetical protein
VEAMPPAAQLDADMNAHCYGTTVDESPKQHLKPSCTSATTRDTTDAHCIVPQAHQCSTVVCYRYSTRPTAPQLAAAAPFAATARAAPVLLPACNVPEHQHSREAQLPMERGLAGAGCGQPSSKACSLCATHVCGSRLSGPWVHA